ncbi:MAG TPA: NAD(P)/FAD-dependent oxidoreductase [Actinomycetes bacterium]|jgi:dihydrolipoamide dehydrogenase|nr:NAD(P)/FAD-dependent oxidoreductase [Actinomycetes bacterium]
MPETLDVIVLGMGPGGEVAASRLLGAGRRVAVIERELIGGECAYWACIPSKTLLRAPEIRSQAAREPGIGTPALDWPAIADYRDWMTRHLDDQAQVRGYQDQGAMVVRGSGRLLEPGQVEVDGQRLQAEHVILATGSDPLRPPIEGLDQVEVWTNREATQLRDVPGRALMIGGGPVGIELGQLLARLGCQVTLVQRAERLLDREDPRVGDLIGKALSDEGVDVRTGRQVVRVSRHADGALVQLDDGATVETDVIVIGAGRTPRTGGLGLERVGGQAGRRGVRVDERCQVVGAEGLWAIGDVTGVALFTHVAKYQGRIVADNLLGRTRRASYQGVPRVVFSDPEIAAVGLTQAQAHQASQKVVTATVSLPDALARPWTYEGDPRGELGLVADRDRGVLLGAWAVAPLASEWIHLAALAVRAEIPIDVLLDGVAQFPSYSEGFMAALEQLR